MIAPMDTSVLLRITDGNNWGTTLSGQQVYCNHCVSEDTRLIVVHQLSSVCPVRGMICDRCLGVYWPIKSGRYLQGAVSAGYPPVLQPYFENLQRTLFPSKDP